MDDPSIVVLEYGSSNFRAGFAQSFPSEEEPRIVTPTAVQITQQQQQQHEQQPGPSLQPGPPTLHHPVVHGQVCSLDQVEALIHHCLYNRLGWAFGSEGCVVLCEPLLSSKLDKEHMAQLMFEVFNVSGLFTQDQAVLSLYGMGKVTGSVVDVGLGKVDVATVVDGQLNSPSVRRLPFGGEDLDRLLGELMRKRGVELGAGRQARALKEMCMQTADNAAEFERLGRAAEARGTAGAGAGATGLPGAAGGGAGSGDRPIGPSEYTLPDGQKVTVDAEGLVLGEALFRPELLGVSGPGLAESLMDSVQTQYEGNFRRPALENMLVCGGGSGAANLPQRLLKEVRALAPPSLQPALCVVPEYMPKHACQHAAWLGGAVLGKVVHAQNQFVTKWDYEEAGPSVVNRRCC